MGVETWILAPTNYPNKQEGVASRCDSGRGMVAGLHARLLAFAQGGEAVQAWIRSGGERTVAAEDLADPLRGNTAHPRKTVAAQTQRIRGPIHRQAARAALDSILDQSASFVSFISITLVPLIDPFTAIQTRTMLEKTRV